MKNFIVILCMVSMFKPASGQTSDSVSHDSGRIFASIGISNILPISPFAFLIFAFTAGAGFEISSHWNAQITYEALNSNLIMPVNSEYFDISPNFSIYQLEVRYKVYKDIYLSAASGLSYFWIDSLNYYSHDQAHNKITTPGFTKTLPTESIGIGISLRHFFSDFKYSFELSKIGFPNGEQSQLIAFGFRVGYIIRF